MDFLASSFKMFFWHTPTCKGIQDDAYLQFELSDGKTTLTKTCECGRGSNFTHSETVFCNGSELSSNDSKKNVFTNYLCNKGGEFYFNDGTFLYLKKENSDLSATDRAIYHLSCFLESANLKMSGGDDYVAYPLIIVEFFDRIDEAIKLDGIAEQFLQANRQIIIILPQRNLEMLQKTKLDIQIIKIKPKGE